MNKNEITKHIDSMIYSSIDLKEKTNILLEIQDYINENLSILKEQKINGVLEEYLEKYKCNEDDSSYTLECKYEVDRDFQEIFTRILNEINIDGYGSFEGDVPKNIKDEYKETFKYGGYENDTFYIRPYNWNGISYEDCSCGLDDKLEELGYSKYKHGFHSKHCIAWETNFYYKPTGLKIEWYKYPLRSAYSNHVLEKDILKAILQDCVKSVTSQDKQNRNR